jgi:glycogen debranching enzyme
MLGARFPAELIAVLCELGGVEQLSALGSNGPLLASGGSTSLFHCLFGRDSMRMATDLLDDFPAVARATLIELARLQGVTINPRAEEEPGRILHEFRHPDDPHMPGTGEWDFPYYGAVDTTPQWITLLHAYALRCGLEILEEEVINRAGVRMTLRDSLLAALAWIVGRMDDPICGGYVWVRRANQYGIPNQVWEDSPDSHYHEDGTVLDPRQAYAPVAVQGYTYDALLAAADLLDWAPGPLLVATATFRARAARLRRGVLRDFWQPDLGAFAMAMAADPSGRLRPVRVVASSAGHLLASRLLEGGDAASKRERLIRRLLEPDMLSGPGIRTKSTGAARFRAGSYHNGSSWPMDTGVIADGLRRWGHHALARDLDRRILAGCAEVGGFPEFFRGEPDRLSVNHEIVDLMVDGVRNRLEQPPQLNQGWTATRVWRILRRHDAPATAGGRRMAEGQPPWAAGVGLLPPGRRPGAPLVLVVAGAEVRATVKLEPSLAIADGTASA